MQLLCKAVGKLAYRHINHRIDHYFYYVTVTAFASMNSFQHQSTSLLSYL